LQGYPTVAFTLDMYVEVAEDLADSAMEALAAYISGSASEDRQTRPFRAWIRHIFNLAAPLVQ
jgi:hypothetical protein